ncbi:MAG: GTPase HflX [Gammaproteobacteria bacterium]|nr:GTPase HflX [Gammaproteobacteria bacterium]MDE0364137.1 GTPase HflX [Gammaproteobacteria bacterium]
MFFDRFAPGRHAVLLDVEFRGAERFDAGEFRELAGSAEVGVALSIAAKRRERHPRLLVGEGKAKEVRAAVARHSADLVLVNEELSPGQQRNLERVVGCRVMTRTELILNIFAERARTFEGKLQVELAQLQHARTRLVRGWTHLDRQKGGIGLRGGGETQIELDKRMLTERIGKVRSRLEQVAGRRAQGRRRRGRSGAATVSLVGYTNAGKSTLFNALTAARTVAEDRLFATLDPTMRRLDVPGAGEVVLADTVGFVSRLPHTLIDAFKATLEEVINADLLVHVVDRSAPESRWRRREVERVLREIGADSVPVVTALNKCDLIGGARSGPLKGGTGNTVQVSAKTGEGLERLVEAIGAALGVQAPVSLALPLAAGRARAWLYEKGAVLGEEITEDGGTLLTVRADAGVRAHLDRLLRDFADEPS